MPEKLCRAFRAGAAHRGTVFIADDRRTANRAHGRQMIRDRSLRPLIMEHRHDFRDNFPGLLHQDRITNADILLRNEILIVKGGICYSSACQPHRLDDRLRRQHTSPADLYNDVQDLGRLLLRRVLIGGRPARELCRAPQGCPFFQAVDLDDGTVNIERELLPAVAYLLDLMDTLFDGNALGMRNHLEVLLSQIVQ